jgi:hypothetical protein
MKTLTAIRAEQGLRATGRSQAPQLALVEERKTRPIDVISPNATILVLDKGALRPLGKGEQPSNRVHLVKTNGLSEQQEMELKEQNVKVHRPEGAEAPYIEVSPLTARWLMDMASGAIGCH